MKREQIISLVKQFYEEKEIVSHQSVDGNSIAARIVLFVEWAEEQKKGNTESWAKIFQAQNTDEVFNWQ